MAVKPEPFNGRPLVSLSDAEWAKATDAEKSRVVEKELRRVADLLLSNFQPRTPWSRKDWERIESFLNKP